MQKTKIEGLNRTNYTPNPNEKHLVHYKAELTRFNKTTGAKESNCEILKTGVKMFETVKRNLEKQGYAIEIIYHPQGKYNTPIPTVQPDEKDYEIEALRKQLAEANAKLAEKEAPKDEKEDAEEAIDLDAPEEAAKETQEVKEAPKPKSTNKTTKKSAKK